jgi:cell wall-associated NlpC family hydrolase
MLNFKSGIFKLVAIFLFGFSLESYSQEVDTLKKMVSIIGTGDIMLGSNYPASSKLPANDGKDLFHNVKDILKDADVTFGNLEGCFLDAGGTPKPCKSKKACYFFRMPDRYVNHLSDAGYDLINIANNHLSDFGEAGRVNTPKVLKNAGLFYAGLKDICETSVFEKDSIKYGFCGFAPNSGTVKITDIAYAKKIVAELDSICDIVIVSFHGGAEGNQYTHVPKKAETYLGENRGDVHEFAHAVIDAGADVVFGHGPHVVRAAELYKDRFIIYSMGNFCTSGEVNISGVNGYAPIVKVFTDKEGVFQNAQIFSALQKDKSGPILDERNAAAKEIKRLTESDFPQTKLVFFEDGRVDRKEESKDIKKMKEVQEENVEVGQEMALMQIAEDLMKSGQGFSGNGSVAETIIDFSKQYLGSRYRRGTTGPKTFDCSGFTSFVFKNFGYNLSPGCVTQVNQGTRIDKEELKTGDLIFFKGRNAKSSRVGHVGIVVANNGNGSITFIHACRRGVIIEELSSSVYYKPRYVTGLRVLGDNANG